MCLNLLTPFDRDPSWYKEGRSVSSSGQRNPQDKTQGISGSLPLLKSFLSSVANIVSGPTDAEPLLLQGE